VGSKSDGLINFLEHYANKMTQKGKTVYFTDFSANNSAIAQIAQDTY
jgi:hypothetical protein